jgi:hypothetical protein
MKMKIASLKRNCTWKLSICKLLVYSFPELYLNNSYGRASSVTETRFQCSRATLFCPQLSYLLLQFWDYVNLRKQIFLYSRSWILEVKTVDQMVDMYMISTTPVWREVMG